MKQALLIAVLVFSACTTAKKPELTTPSVRSGINTEALQLSLPQFPGGEVWTLKSERGRVVVLDVWATWCEPCRDALPLYQDIAKQFEARGLKVYAVNIDAEQKLIAPFLQDAKVNLPVLLDPEARVSEAVLKVKLMPSTFFIDKRGVLRHSHEGFDEGQLSTWLEEIEALLAEPDPETK